MFQLANLNDIPVLNVIKLSNTRENLEAAIAGAASNAGEFFIVCKHHQVKTLQAELLMLALKQTEPIEIAPRRDLGTGEFMILVRHFE